MKDSPAYPIRVFYDGACPVCSREIRHYLRLDREGNLLPVDISGSDFDPAPWGISREAFMAAMHVIDRKGRVFRGVEGFRAIWLAFPEITSYRLLARLVSLPPVRSIAGIAYACFARLRRFLPATSRCTGRSCRTDQLR